VPKTAIGSSGFNGIYRRVALGRPKPVFHHVHIAVATEDLDGFIDKSFGYLKKFFAMMESRIIDGLEISQNMLHAAVVAA
jgi:hypothetical protein